MFLYYDLLELFDYDRIKLIITFILIFVILNIFNYIYEKKKR